MPRCWIGSENGNVGVVFGLMFVLMTGVLGVAIDLGIGITKRQRLQTAADSAALVAVKAISDGESWATAQGKAAAFFSTNVPGLQKPAATFALDPRPGNPVVTVEASATWPRGVSSIVISEDMYFRVKSEAAKPKLPLDIYFVVDVSYSMGIGADQIDVDLMNSKLGCAFACHLFNGVENAHGIGANLRVDVARTAVLKSIDAIVETKEPDAVVRVAVIPFSSRIVRWMEPTEDLSAARTAAQAIALPVNDNQGGTNFHAALKTVQDTIALRQAAHNDGTTAVVMLVTDGVENTRMIPPGNQFIEIRDNSFPVTMPYHSYDPNTDIMAMAPDLCNGIKSTGALMMVVSVEYVTNNVGAAEPVASLLLPIMPQRAQMCASQPDYVRHANDSASMKQAIDELTRLAVSKSSHVSQ